MEQHYPLITALESDCRWVHELQSRRSSLLQASLQRDGGWIWEWSQIILKEFLEELQTERRERFDNREDVQWGLKKEKATTVRNISTTQQSASNPSLFFHALKTLLKKQQEPWTDREVSLPESCSSTPRPDPYTGTKPCNRAGAAQTLE